MEYISKIDSFYQWLQNNTLSTGAISLYHALLNLRNKDNTSFFRAKTSKLQHMTGLYDMEFMIARKELFMKRLISFRYDKNGDYINYEIKDLDHKVVQEQDQLNGYIILNGEQKYIAPSLIPSFKEMLGSISYMQIFCMNNRISQEEYKAYLATFFVELTNRGEKYKDIQEAKFHFSNWIKSELRNKQSYAKNKSTGTKTRPTSTQSSSWTNTINSDSAGVEALINSIAIG